MNYSGKEKRMYPRLEYPNLVCTKFSAISHNNESDACIKDIGAGGLKLISDKDLETDSNEIIEFSSIIPIIFKGFIIRKIKLENDCFEYGVKFVSSYIEKNLVNEILNDCFPIINSNYVNTCACNSQKLNCPRKLIGIN